MKTFGVKYLGSKLKLLPALCRIFERIEPRSALDVFSGTTRVAQALRWMGVYVTTSDVASYSRAFSSAWVSGSYDMRYVDYIAAKLDRMQGHRGWFTSMYCDVPGVKGGTVRFMSPENGIRVDGIRDSISDMLTAGTISVTESDVLVATLMLAMDKVDNTVGIQQAYLKDWCPRSQRRLSMQTYAPPPGPLGQHVTGDVLNVGLPTADLAYLDPPYNQHVYLTNYHIWESIMKWDKPQVDLKTNRRADLCRGAGTSAWNRKAHAVAAFRKLLGDLDVGTVIISYAEGSHMCLEELVDTVAETHVVTSIEQLEVDENIMSTIGNGPLTRQRPRRIEWIVQATTALRSSTT